MVKGIFHHKLFRLEYAPIWILLLSFLLRLPVYLIHTFGYWYDEIIFLSIAKLPFSQMFDTLLAEPKPPGAYVLFHYLPTDNALTTRLALMVAAYTLTGIALWYGYATRVIQHYKLHLGLALFFSSFTFLRLTVYVKPYESAGLLLTIFFFLVALNIVRERLHTNTKYHIFLLHAITLFALFFNYIAYLFIMIGLTAVTFVLRKKKPALWLFATQLLIVGAYAGIFGYEQSQTALGRGIWSTGMTNSIFFTIETHLNEYKLLEKSFMFDIAFGLFLWCIYKGIQYTRVSSERTFRIGLIILTAVFMIIGYRLHLLRYYRQAYTILLPISIIAGWGLYEVKKKAAIGSVIALLFFVGLAAQAREYRLIDKEDRHIVAALSDSIERDRPTGVVSDMPLMVYAYKMEYFHDASLYVPVNAYEGEALPTMYITKEHLTSNRSVLDIENRYERVVRQLQSSQLDRFIFLQYWMTAPIYYIDPDQTILQVLIDECRLGRFQFIGGTGMYEFEECGYGNN